MANLIRLVTMLNSFPRPAFDAIFPHGPVLSAHPGAGVTARAAADLNPQPLPPKDALLVATAAAARDIALAAVAADAAGADGASRMVTTAVEDWCGTRHPGRPIPWPRRWPFPDPDPEPEPHPEWDVNASLVAGGLSLALVANQLADGDVRDALTKGADQMLEVGLAG